MLVSYNGIRNRQVSELLSTTIILGDNNKPFQIYKGIYYFPFNIIFLAILSLQCIGTIKRFSDRKRVIKLTSHVLFF